MKNKNNLWVFVAVSLVVGIIASLATASITGNIVRVQQNPAGPSVYTIAEVNAKLNVLQGSCEYVSSEEVLVDKQTKIPFTVKTASIKDACKKAFGYAPKAVVSQVTKTFCLGEGCDIPPMPGSGKSLEGGISVNESVWEPYTLITPNPEETPNSKVKKSKITGTDIPYSYVIEKTGVYGILCCK